jgi:hypothetical protein
MKHHDMRSLYLRDLEAVPTIRRGIDTAAKSSNKSLTLSFRLFEDNPMLLYAVVGYAVLQGVSITFSVKQ